MIAGELESALVGSDPNYSPYYNFFNRPRRTEQERQQARARRQTAMRNAQETIDRNGGLQNIINTIGNVASLFNQSQQAGPVTPANYQTQVPPPSERQNEEKGMNTIYVVAGGAVVVGLILVGIHLMKRRNAPVVVEKA